MAHDRLDIQFYEAFAEEANTLRRFLPGGIRAEFTPKTIQECGDDTPPARLISIRTQSIIPAMWANGVSGILTRATGYDGLLRFRADTNSRAQLGYLPLYCARAVAEQAMLMWMALLRKLPLQLQEFPKFHRDGLTGRECEHKHLLVVGVGHIGSEVGKIGRGLGMEVRGIDLVQRHAEVRYVSKDEGIPWADVIVCAMNLTSDNVGYFDQHTLSKAKRGVIFVNVARGEMSPAADLLRMLEEGHLGGVALDVYEQESQLAVALRSRRASDDPSVTATLALAKRPNVICTPHNAFNTVESVERKSQQSVQQVEQFLKHGTFLWTVPER